MADLELAPSTKSYFRKEIVTTPLYFKTGGKVPFVIYGEIGLLETDDTVLVQNLNIAVSRRMGGVTVITKEDYDELKKNPPEMRLKPTSLNPWENQRNSQQAEQEGKNAVADQKTAPIKKPEAEPLLAQLNSVKKRVSKISDVMDALKKQEVSA